MQYNTNALIHIDPDNFLIRFCHNMHWYAKDTAKMNTEISGGG
jgi:hypothetical protein